MIESNIICLASLEDEKKQQAVEVFVDGFKNVMSFTKDETELKELFLQAFDYSLLYAYVYKDRVVGVLGLGTNEKRVAHFDVDVCQKIFGTVKGYIISKQLGMILETPTVKNDTDLYIDYLTTDVSMRGKGIGTKLLDFACQLPGYQECYIEVLSKNIKAKRLYEMLGFKAYKKGYNFFTVIQGHGYPVKMKKQCK